MTHPIPCKCCNADSPFIGSLDFNKTCMDRLGKRTFDLSPIEVKYNKCSNCGFIFTNHMDNWTAEEFKDKVYNSEYGLADGVIPGFEAGIEDPLQTISYGNGANIANFFLDSKDQIKVLDFGAGGNPGNTGLALIDKGFDVTSYEPYMADQAVEIKYHQYDLIIAIEVIEHCHNLNEVGDLLSKLLSRDGILWIQTLIHPHPAENDILSSWYIAPRNGHISIFTLPALTALFRRYEINVVQTAFGLIGFKHLPTFKNVLFV